MTNDRPHPPARRAAAAALIGLSAVALAAAVFAPAGPAPAAAAAAAAQEPQQAPPPSQEPQAGEGKPQQDTAKPKPPRNPYYSRTDTTPLNVSEAEWKRVLPPDVYYIARLKGTEPPGSGKYDTFDGKGTYYCAPCGNKLFRSDAKFATTCGWPSFFQTVRPGAVLYQEDRSHNMIRVEVLCGRCKGHLGHVFNDGPPPTGRRYCMNSLVLDFEPDKPSAPANAKEGAAAEAPEAPASVAL